MTTKFDIQSDELVLLMENGKYIVGYTIHGGYNEEQGDVKIKRDILPDGFFSDFAPDKYLYYKKTNEVIVNKNYEPPSKSIEDEDYQPPKEYVPKEDYDKLESKVDKLERMLQQLLAQKG
ncbi:hypothetical protein VL10_ORF122 [Staphylococcus phage vB_SauM_VL10]|nr:hypothetical protein VL10_ORF122 [Staphylococcus phage vB_SauM_VL10]